MDFEMLKTFFTVIGIICGFIITITGAITGLTKLKDILGKNKEENMLNMKQTLNTHTTDINEIKKDICQLKSDIQENKEMTRLICKGVKCLMDNSITGNGIENLKKTRKELDDFLIETK